MGRGIDQMSWPGGENDFLLRYGEIEILQDKCDAGPEFIFNSLAARTYLQGYAFEVLRLGLIGGGMDPDKARRRINKARDDYPIRDFVIPAMNVLGAAVVGYKDDPVGETDGGSENPTPPEANGDLAASTEAEPS